MAEAAAAAAVSMKKESNKSGSEEVTDLSSSDVCTKYQAAAKIVNDTLQRLVDKCVPEATVLELCEFGHTAMMQSAAKLYTKPTTSSSSSSTTTNTNINNTSHAVVNSSNGQHPLQNPLQAQQPQRMDRGVAFPVCISVNDVVCNDSPLVGDERPPLKVGDVVKIDLGCHMDGYIAIAAHTCIVHATKAEPESSSPESAAATTTAVDDNNNNNNNNNVGSSCIIEPAMHQVAVAAYHAMLVAAQTIQAGATNTQVTQAVERVAAHYQVTSIASVRMHQMKRYVLDGVKEVALATPKPYSTRHEQAEEKLEECTFEQGEVYAVDVAMSTGNGHARPGLRTTVFKRNVEQQYSLKVPASRVLLSEVDKKFPTLPFTLRHLSDMRKARLGLAECIQRELLLPYPTLYEHSGKVAHFKCTVLLLPSGTVRITGLNLPSYFKPTKEPDAATAAVLKTIEEEEAKRAARKAAKKDKKKK